MSLLIHVTSGPAAVVLPWPQCHTHRAISVLITTEPWSYWPTSSWPLQGNRSVWHSYVTLEPMGTSADWARLSVYACAHSPRAGLPQDDSPPRAKGRTELVNHLISTAHPWETSTEASTPDPHLIVLLLQLISSYDRKVMRDRVTALPFSSAAYPWNSILIPLKTWPLESQQYPALPNQNSQLSRQLSMFFLKSI